MNNIILIGFMGSGKTTVGKELAKTLSFDFCDSDTLIEKKAGQSVKEIFAVHGEPYFRGLETDLVKELTGQISNTVLSVGGGLPIQPGNAELLHRLGTVIYLSANRNSIKSRLAGDSTRPLLNGSGGESRFEKLYTYREPIYKAVSNLMITTDNKNIEEIVRDILNNWR